MSKVDIQIDLDSTNGMALTCECHFNALPCDLTYRFLSVVSLDRYTKSSDIPIFSTKWISPKIWMDTKRHKITLLIACYGECKKYFLCSPKQYNMTRITLRITKTTRKFFSNHTRHKARTTKGWVVKSMASDLCVEHHCDSVGKLMPLFCSHCSYTIEVCVIAIWSITHYCCRIWPTQSRILSKLTTIGLDHDILLLLQLLSSLIISINHD